MKNKLVKILFAVFILSLIFFTQQVFARETRVKLQRIISATKLDSDGHFDYTGPNMYTPQGMVVTDKYIIISYHQYEKENHNWILYYDKKTYKHVKTQYIRNELTCSHANDMTYVKKDNRIVCAATDDNKGIKRLISYGLDKNGFIDNSHGNKTFKIINTGNYRITNISYDKDTNTYWTVTPSDGIISYTINYSTNKIVIKNTISANSLGNFGLYDGSKYRINQASHYYNGYIYLLNWPSDGASKYNKSVSFKVKGEDMIIYSYCVNKNKCTVGSKGNILYNRQDQDNFSGNKAINRYREIEAITDDNGYFYYLFQFAGRMEVYVMNSINATVTALEKDNNNALFKNIGLSANFKSSKSNLSLNKDVKYNSSAKGYSLPLTFNLPGVYKLNIAQSQKTLNGWTFDKSKLTASVDVIHDPQANYSVLPNYKVTWVNANNRFSNTFKYESISVPISVKSSISTPDDYAAIPKLSATLIDANGKEKKTVSVENKKYDLGNLYFDKPGTYTYTIKQKNSGTTNSGIYTTTIDPSVVTVTINVTGNNGKLSYKVNYNKTSFINKITAKYNEVVNNFTIPIKTTKKDNLYPTPETNLILTSIIANKVVNTKNIKSNNNAYNFDIKISKPGIYYYKILQDTGITGNGIYDYKLDDNVINFVIVATVKNNKLICENNLINTKFINEVVANYNQISVPIEVGIISSSTTNNLTIPLTKATITGKNVSDTIESLSEKYKYTISFKDKGTYTYKIQQKNMSFDNLLYNRDTDIITVTIRIISENNELKCDSIQYSKNEFNNSFSANVDPLKLTIRTNILTESNDDTVAIPKTEAELYDNNNELIKTVQSNKDKYIFNNVVIQDEGTYEYTIKQKILSNNNPNVDYEFDSKIIKATIVVDSIEIDGDIKLRANVSYSNNEFKNKINITYSPISVNAVYNINNIINDGARKNITNKAVLLDSNNQIISTKEEIDDKYIFSLSFDKPGDYIYKVKQELLDNNNYIENGNYAGILDREQKQFIVHVISNNGVLETSVEYKNDDNMFENEFVKSLQILRVPLEINIETNTKNKNVNTPITEAILSEIDENDNLIEIEKVTSINSKYTFNSLCFSQPGVYTYEVSQLNTGISETDKLNYNISKDKKIIEITVTENNETGTLSYSIDGNDKPFENIVSVKYDPIIIPLSVNIIDDNQANIIVPEKTILFSDGEKVLNKIVTSENVVVSNNITVVNEGVYTYKIFQKRPHNYIKNGVEYILDSNVIMATVEVKANLENILEYNIEYNNSNTFTNYYNLTEKDEKPYLNVPINIDIYSNTDDVKSLPTQATLYRDGIPVETVLNENGRYSFNNVDLSVEGLYTYTIKQLNYENDNWSIDDSEIQIEINTFQNEVVPLTNNFYKINNSKPKLQLLGDDEIGNNENENLYEEDDANNELGEDGTNSEPQYTINFINNKTAFTNTDDNALESIEDVEEPEKPTTVEVPNTGISNSLFIAFGMLLISLGIAIIIYKKDDIFVTSK